MAGPRSTRTIVLASEQRAEREHVQRSPAVAAGRARRAGIVLLAAEKVRLQQIAVRVGVQRRVVRDWLDRFRAQAVAGLQDRPRSGRPRTFAP